MAESLAPWSHAPRGRTAVAFLLLAALIVCGTAWARDLFDADEGRYGAVAAEMHRSGDWVVPRLDGMPFLDKPPLVYHVQVLGYALVGESAFLARSPTLLAGLLWAFFLFLLAWRWTGRPAVAWCAGLLAVTSAAGTIGASVGPQMDMPLAAAVAGVLLAASAALEGSGRRARIGLGLAVGCGLLIKGPLVVAVPALVAGAWALAGVAPRRILAVLFSPLAWGVALLVAAPWYIAIEQAVPGWIQHFIVYEHFGRFSEGDHRAFRPLWFYVPITLLYMCPWAALAWNGPRLRLSRWVRPWVALVVNSPWSPRPWSEALPETRPIGRAGAPVPVARLAWLWFVAAFVLYSLAERKLLNYLLPAAAPLFLLLGARLQQVLDRRAWQARWMPLTFGIGTILVGVLLAWGLWVPFGTGRLPTGVESLRVAPAGPWFLAAGTLLAAGALLWPWGRTPRARVAGLLAGAALAWGCIDLGFAAIDEIGSSARLARALRERTGPQDVALVYKRYPQGLGFYHAPRLWIAGGTPDDWEQREIVNPFARSVWEAQSVGEDGLPELGAGGGLLTQTQFETLWKDPERSVLLVCRWREIAPLRAWIVAGPFAGAGRTDLFLVRNRRPASE